MKVLTKEQAKQLCEWAEKNAQRNWGSWSSNNYPIGGCSYLQYDNNPVIVKFDSFVAYNDLEFKRIGWGRVIPGKEKSITFSDLVDELEKDGVEFEKYPEERFTKIIDGKEIKYLIRQDPYSCLKKRQICVLNNDDNIIRKGLTPKSWMYPY